MPRATTVIAIVAVIAVLVGGGALLAVSGGDGAPAPRPGYTTYEAKVGEHVVTFAYPQAWGAV